MEIPTSALVIFVLIGFVPAILLWVFGLVAWWAVPLLTLPFALLIVAIIALLMTIAWMAGGSH